MRAVAIKKGQNREKAVDFREMGSLLLVKSKALAKSP